MRSMHKTLLLPVCAAIVLAMALAVSPAFAGSSDDRSGTVLRNWYRLTLELVRHTPTYSPPVASRSFAYLGIAAFEVVASGDAGLVTLSGQLNAMPPMPQRDHGREYDDAVALQAAMSAAVRELFGNTGPTGLKAMDFIAKKLDAEASAGVGPDVAERSAAYGHAVAEAILGWSRDDGGAVVDNLGFPSSHVLTPGPAHWVPTNLIGIQQKPLLPEWGENRTFAMPDGATCGLPPPPEYSEDEGSDFHREAREVYDTVNALTDEQRAIARFWSDDPMLSPTPPGHWLSIALHVLDKDGHDLGDRVDALARLGIVLADAFIGCWHEKYKFDLVRPVTYIRRLIDPDWDAILITPPFPEYPSGHSTQSGAAADVLTDVFGEDYAFTDTTHEDDGLPSRDFASFWDAAEEAGISRLYGGIHYRAAIERGLDQGRCIAAHVNALRTRR